MTRYFFHIRATTMLDQEGIELQDLEAVREQATTLARQSMSERVLDGHAPNGRTFVVTDEQGQTVLTFPFKLAIHD